jgi:hypothetical protein
MESESSQNQPESNGIEDVLSMLERSVDGAKERALDVLNESRAGKRKLTDRDIQDYYGEYLRQREEGILPEEKMKCSAPDKIAARYALNLRLAVIFPVDSKKLLFIIRSIFNDAQLDALLELSENDFRTEVSAIIAQYILDKFSRFAGIREKDVFTIIPEEFFEERSFKFLTFSESQLEQFAKLLKLLVD